MIQDQASAPFLGESSHLISGLPGVAAPSCCHREAPIHPQQSQNVHGVALPPGCWWATRWDHPKFFEAQARYLGEEEEEEDEDSEEEGQQEKSPEVVNTMGSLISMFLRVQDFKDLRLAR